MTHIKFYNILINIIKIFIPNDPSADKLRGILYKPLMKKCGKNFKVATGAYIYSPSKLSVGDNVYIGFSSYLGNGEIILEDEVLIGNFVSITPSNHSIKFGSFRFGKPEFKPIIIRRGSWLAAHSCVLAGVEIGAGSLIAAGAVVTHDVSEKTIVTGVPARERI
jgi:maltose O-acetyltransferase